MVNAFGEARQGAVTIPIANEIINIINSGDLDCAQIREVIDIVQHALDWRVSEMRPQLNPFVLKD